MSRDIILYIAASLDGYIAKSDGSVDWLLGESSNPNVDTGYNEFYSSIDTVVMGRTTYEQVINELSPDVWVYEGKKCFVATSIKRPSNEKAEFVSEDIVKFVKGLKNHNGKDIWIVGGGKLIAPFIKNNLVDKYIITIIPTVLGGGIPLFPGENPEIKLKLIETRTIDGMVQITYITR